eukprot:scaffold81388_cov19-Prasinocladus_malaysianus.AAC.2
MVFSSPNTSQGHQNSRLGGTGNTPINGMSFCLDDESLALDYRNRKEQSDATHQLIIRQAAIALSRHIILSFQTLLCHN